MVRQKTINPLYLQSHWIFPTTLNRLLSDHQCRCGWRGSGAKLDNSSVPPAGFVVALQLLKVCLLSYVPVHPMWREVRSYRKVAQVVVGNNLL